MPNKSYTTVTPAGLGGTGGLGTEAPRSCRSGLDPGWATDLGWHSAPLGAMWMEREAVWVVTGDAQWVRGGGDGGPPDSGFSLLALAAVSPVSIMLVWLEWEPSLASFRDDTLRSRIWLMKLLALELALALALALASEGRSEVVRVRVEYERWVEELDSMVYESGGTMELYDGGLGVM